MKNLINFIVWLTAGAVIGWFASRMVKSQKPRRTPGKPVPERGPAPQSRNEACCDSDLQTNNTIGGSLWEYFPDYRWSDRRIFGRTGHEGVEVTV